MTAALLPGMGSLSRLSEWIENHEALYASHVLEADDAQTLCAAFLSLGSDGAFRVRMCAGDNDELMVWRQQRRITPMFGQAGAEATLGLWLSELEREGFRSTWSARRTATQTDSRAGRRQSSVTSPLPLHRRT